MAFGDPRGERGFVARFTADGSILDSITIGGFLEDRLFSINLDNAGNMTILGDTRSSNFPLSLDCYLCEYSLNGDLIVVKLGHFPATATTTATTTTTSTSTTTDPTADLIASDVLFTTVVLLVLFGYRRHRKS